MKTLTKIMVLAFAALILMPAGAQAQKKNQKIGIVAHRGFWNCEEAGKAQNSIASLKCAQEAGVWGSEFDVFLTSDEQLVVNHDAVFQGVEIEATPYDEVRKLKLANGEQIPNIDEYLTQGKKCKKTVLVYEVK
jgi:glycerophosphoryl diester phosphodiesterase